MRLGRWAVEAAQGDNPDLALCRSNLGLTLHTRYERLGVAQNLTESVHLCRMAVDAAASGDPSLPVYMTNLGVALHAAADAGRDAEADTALASYRDAVQRLRPHH